MFAQYCVFMAKMGAIFQYGMLYYIVAFIHLEVTCSLSFHFPLSPPLECCIYNLTGIKKMAVVKQPSLPQR